MQRVRDLMEAAGDEDDRVIRLCTSAVGALEVTGVGLSMTDGTGQHSKIAATDVVSHEIEDLQVLLGQGPCVDAVASREPVLVGDLSLPEVESRWPIFTPAATALGVCASFSLPLLVGQVPLGAMDLYRTDVGELHPAQVAHAQDYASAAVNMLLQRADSVPGDGASVTAPDAAVSSAVHQATGMVMVQLGTDAAGAFAALRARAFQEGRSLGAVAADVLDRRVRLTDEEV